MPFLPPMTGNGNGDFSGGLFFFPPHDDDLRVRNLSKVLKVRKQLQRLGDRGQAHIPSLSKVLRQFSDVVSPTEMPMTWKIYAFDDRKCDGKNENAKTSKFDRKKYLNNEALHWD